MQCTICGAEMPDYSGFCPSCGRSVTASAPAVAVPAATPAVSTGSDRLLGALAYVTIVPAIVFLLMEPYKKNRYVRFHAFQSLFLCGALIVIAFALGFILKLLAFIPFVGHLLNLLAWPVLCVGCLLLWLVLLLKAYQGESFKLPMIGNWAERQADA